MMHSESLFFPIKLTCIILWLVVKGKMYKSHVYLHKKKQEKLSPDCMQ